MITRESLEKKVVALKAQLEQIQASGNVTVGAIKLAELLIQELAAAETPKPSDPTFDS